MRSDPLTVFYRRQTTGVHRTNSDAVVVGENVSENNGLDLCSGELVCRDLVDLLLLQGSKKALHSGIIKAMPGSAEALNNAEGS